jgi:hypothetical protein
MGRSGGDNGDEAEVTMGTKRMLELAKPPMHQDLRNNNNIYLYRVQCNSILNPV